MLVDEVQAYYTAIYGGPDRTPMVADEFAPPAGDFVLLTLDDVPVATGGWRRGGPRPGDGEVKRMFVRPTHRGRGLARAVLAWLESSARAAGVERLVLETGAPQTEAVAFYRAAGFTPIEPFGFYSTAAGSVHLAKPLT